MIDIASPFGGYKQPAFGREGNRHTIDLFTN
jgi:hypothetical protein